MTVPATSLSSKVVVIRIPILSSSSSLSLTLDCVANVVDKWLQVGVVAGERAVVREMDKWWEAGLRAGMDSGGKEKSRCHGRTIGLVI